MIKKLKIKVKHSHLELLPNVLLTYRDFVAIMVESTRKNHRNAITEVYFIKLSIAAQLYFAFQKKALKRYPTEKPSLELEIHEAIVLQAALLHYVTVTKDPFVNNAVDMMKNDLNQKLENNLTFITQ